MARNLLSLALSTFHIAFLVAVGVLLAHLTGGLGDFLKGLNTLLGLGLFAVLWAVVWWATGNVLAVVSVSDVVSWSGTKAVILRGTLWGGAVGVLFFAGFVAVAVLSFLFRPTGAIQPSSVLLILLIGGAIAFGVGGIVGISFAVLDVALIRVAHRVGGNA